MKHAVIGAMAVVLVAALGSLALAQDSAEKNETAETETANTVKLEQPILISSAGQSADAKLVGMLAKRLKLNATTEPMANAGNLDGIKTLVIVPGFSSKGLGAAGIKPEEEEARVSALIAAAQEKGIPIVVVHVGGTARRGPQSDGFNRQASEAACQMIVVKQGDEDGFFDTIGKDKSIPLVLVDKIAQAAEPLGQLFN